MQHASTVTRPLLASIALRAVMFWEHRMQSPFTTDAERQAAARQLAAFRAQYQVLTAERRA